MRLTEKDQEDAALVSGIIDIMTYRQMYRDDQTPDGRLGRHKLSASHFESADAAWRAAPTNISRGFTFVFQEAWVLYLAATCSQAIAGQSCDCLCCAALALLKEEKK